MQLEDQAVVTYLTANGFENLNFLLELGNDRVGIVGLVMGTDGFGIWLSLAGEGWRRALIVPWHYIRAIEFELETEPSKEMRKSIGFQG
jgi:hypothetical protein